MSQPQAASFGKTKRSRSKSPRNGRDVCCRTCLSWWAAIVCLDGGPWVHLLAAQVVGDPLRGDLVGESPGGGSAVDIVFSGGWVGLSILLLLLALSLTAAYLIFEHLMTIRRDELMPSGLAEQVRDLVTANKVAEAEAACRQRPSLLSFVLLNGLAELDGGWPSVEKALEDALAEQAARLFRKIEYLSAIGNIAPMVGLLGTVTGMIFAFQRVAATQGSASAGDLAEGIYQALITTVGGLLVAIPSLGAFAILRNRVDQLVAEAAYLAQHVFTPWKRQRSAARRSR